MVTQRNELVLGRDVRRQGGVDFGTLQRAINYWFSYCLDLFGSELSNNAAGYFGAGLKGRFKEADRYSDHQALTQHYTLAGVEDGRLVEREVPLRSAINEVLRDDYIHDCERALRKWNTMLAEMGSPERLRLPHRPARRGLPRRCANRPERQ